MTDLEPSRLETSIDLRWFRHAAIQQIGDSSSVRDTLGKFLRLGAVNTLATHGPLTSNDLAARCHSGPALMAQLLNKLRGYGVVTLTDDLFQLSELSQEFLQGTPLLPGPPQRLPELG